MLAAGHREHKAAGFTSLPTTGTDDLGFVLVPSEASLLSQLYPSCCEGHSRNSVGQESKTNLNNTARTS